MWVAFIYAHYHVYVKLIEMENLIKLIEKTTCDEQGTHMFIKAAYTLCLIKYARSYAALCCVVVNTLRPRQNGRHFADDIFKCIFLNENVWIF